MTSSWEKASQEHPRPTPKEQPALVTEECDALPQLAPGQRAAELGKSQRGCRPRPGTTPITADGPRLRRGCRGRDAVFNGATVFSVVTARHRIGTCHRYRYRSRFTFHDFLDIDVKGLLLFDV